MDIERINLIGTTLADLSARTQELRGYHRLPVPKLMSLRRS